MLLMSESQIAFLESQKAIRVYLRLAPFRRLAADVGQPYPALT
jgi:hypothetical protein